MVAQEELRDIAGNLFESAVKAVEPSSITRRSFLRIRRGGRDREGTGLGIWKDPLYINFSDDSTFMPSFELYPRDTRFHIVALGKAAIKMADTVLRYMVSFRFVDALSLMVISHENFSDIIADTYIADFPDEKKDIIQSSHPFPNEWSVAAGEALIKNLNRLKRVRLFCCC